MTTNTMDKDAGASVAGEAQYNDTASEVASLRERLMRALAETENTRRQGERRAQDAGQYAITNFARELLQVIDNLRRAIEAGAADREGSGIDGLIEGVTATDRILTQILNRFGVEEIKALHQPFDPKKHEAVMATDETDQPPGSVAQVLETGYMLHDRLLRPARGGGQAPATIVASGTTMTLHSLAMTKAQTGVGIGRRSLHNAWREKGR